MAAPDADPPPPLAHPAALLATCGGLGRLPGAPGTWASLAALPLAWLIAGFGGAPALLLATAVVFAAGVWAAQWYVARSGQADPGAIVVDEVAGQWLTLLPVAPGPWEYAAGFLLFRLFDIAKPWPIRRLERSVPGGLGVMLDDVAAGLLGAVALSAGGFLIKAIYHV
jgi:phosphatidylglycerophosphatase A